MATDELKEETSAMIQLAEEYGDNDNDNTEEKQDANNNDDNSYSKAITDDMFLAEGARREIGSMVWIQRIADISLAAETFFCNFAIELYVYIL